MAILIIMGVWRYDVGQIARCSASWASLGATGGGQWASDAKILSSMTTISGPREAVFQKQNLPVHRGTKCAKLGLTTSYFHCQVWEIT